ncbi:beta-lactamase family protein [Dyadobacter flavalbus]|uniref:Beta-lactamase family protein n=1 Tax=Dyadobacter flavalbus TaxID=2579942 RepID=A0A5M8QVW2_9BACT|nr:serine hydrolase domain-containing protein [Dyadobacter flavalbus]KAA6438563.1 beta-lactamase family protein [Dyadobacter flavalbus]
MKYLLGLLPLLLILSCEKNQNKSSTDSGLEAKIDGIVKPHIDKTEAAGMAIGVFKNHKPLFHKAYGFADLELDVKLPINASFEIGSVTKQFTGVAILQLAEQGKITLDDDIEKYLDFNTRNRKVTIRQLLSHTSGIKGYTELPSFEMLSVQKHSRDTHLRIVEKEQFDFEPGEALIYNNTGFFMLGLIIEKVSGMSYEEYVKKNLFDKAQMTNSYYCSEQKITKNRAHGYDKAEKGLVRAAYLDHTWPFSAGSLCSTVEDLEKWNNALHHGKILNKKSYNEFLTPVSLNDDTVTRYAKGITVTNWKGKRLVEHGGGINGFLSQNSYFPDEDVSIIVLINTTSVGAREVADKIADLVLKDFQFNEPVQFRDDLTKFTGSYKGRGRGQDMNVKISKNGLSLLVALEKEKPQTLNYSKGNMWSDGNSNYLFQEQKGQVTGLSMDEVYGYFVLKRE